MISGAEPAAFGHPMGPPARQFPHTQDKHGQTRGDRPSARSAAKPRADFSARSYNTLAARVPIGFAKR